MPGFLSTTTALTVYKLDNPAAVTADKLKEYGFRSIDDIPEPKGWGWTNIDDIFDTEWRFSVPEKGQFLCFSLRVDTRKVSSAVLKKHLAEALREEEAKAQTEERKVSRARKKELKDLYASKLLSKAEPVPAAVDIALDMTTGMLYAGSISGSFLELLEEQFFVAFGVKPKRLVPTGMEDHELEDSSVEALMAKIYADSLQVDFGEHSYTVAEAGQATLMQEGGAEVTVKNAPDSANAGIASGLSIKKLRIQISRTGEDELMWTLTLNSDFTFSGMKTPKVEKATGDNADAAMLEKLYLIEQAVGVVLALGQRQA